MSAVKGVAEALGGERLGAEAAGISAGKGVAKVLGGAAEEETVNSAGKVNDSHHVASKDMCGGARRGGGREIGGGDFRDEGGGGGHGGGLGCGGNCTAGDGGGEVPRPTRICGRAYCQDLVVNVALLKMVEMSENHISSNQKWARNPRGEKL
jgi:hypothetical protein